MKLCGLLLIVDFYLAPGRSEPPWSGRLAGGSSPEFSAAFPFSHLAGDKSSLDHFSSWVLTQCLLETEDPNRHSSELLIKHSKMRGKRTNQVREE